MLVHVYAVPCAAGPKNQSGAPGHRVGFFFVMNLGKIMQDNTKDSTNKVWERIIYLLSL